MVHPQTHEQQAAIGAIVVKFLTTLGWSHEQMAHRCGLHIDEIDMIVTGIYPLTLDTLLRIASAFEMDLQISFLPKRSPTLN